MRNRQTIRSTTVGLIAFGLVSFSATVCADPEFLRLLEVDDLARSEVSKVAVFRKCNREGSVSLQIGKYNFVVPRKILRSVSLSNGQVDRRWPCENIRLEAQSFYISVTRTHAGDSFYENWSSEQRLPVHVEVVRRGRIKNFTSDHLSAAEQRSDAKARIQSGYKVVVSGPNEFFDSSGLGLRAYNGHPVVTQCLNIKLLTGGRKCRASYPYDDSIDILYEFDDSKFPLGEWVELDKRTRDFVKHLMAQG